MSYSPKMGPFLRHHPSCHLGSLSPADYLRGGGLRKLSGQAEATRFCSGRAPSSVKPPGWTRFLLPRSGCRESVDLCAAAKNADAVASAAVATTRSIAVRAPIPIVPVTHPRAVGSKGDAPLPSTICSNVVTTWCAEATTNLLPRMTSTVIHTISLSVTSHVLPFGVERYYSVLYRFT